MELSRFGFAAGGRLSRAVGFDGQDVPGNPGGNCQQQQAQPPLGEQNHCNADGQPEQGHGKYLVTHGQAAALAVVADVTAKPAVVQQPMIKTRRGAGKAGRRQQEENRGWQHRHENPQNAQADKEETAESKKIFTNRHRI